MASTSRGADKAALLQEQEVHRYYDSWLHSRGSPLNVASSVDSISSYDLKEHGYEARASSDKALTAFAQLAALRLNVKRAMVSLVDSKHQYILTEATKTVSLSTSRHHGDSDELWLGSTILVRDEAVCSHALQSTATALDEDGDSHTIRGLVVNDCREDGRFKTRSYVTEESGVRFYAGVPIVSRSGYDIGVYAVSDDRPRAGLSVLELKFMEDVATAVGEHLGWALDRVDRFKGERIAGGLAAFVEKSSGNKAVDQADDSSDDDAPSTTASPRPHFGFIHHEERSSAKTLSKKRSSNDQRALRGHQSTKSSGQATRESFSLAPPSRGHRRQRSDSGAHSIVSKLDHAATALRESTLADGVIFFAAPGTVVAQDEDTSTGAPNPTINPLEPSADDARQSGRVLAVSLRNGDPSAFENQVALGNSTLDRYFTLYPSGKSMFFTQNRNLSSGDDSTSDSQVESSRQADVSLTANTSSIAPTGRKKKSRMDHEELLRLVPGVEHLVFLPLRDFVNDKWFSGCFLWTSSAGRMMSLDRNMSFLKAFGNTIMSEILRSHTARLDQAKTTFIASMSHELRSPLHGILGSIEFLTETSIDSYQAGLISSISDCGRTLLDTLSNLLSYAKMTNMNNASTITEVDLGSLVEEVIEAVCAGHGFKELHFNHLATQRGLSIANGMHHDAKRAAAALRGMGVARQEDSGDGVVCVLIDISPRLNWNVNTNPGALRRIVMNLVGNALNYTSSGFVAVSLRAVQQGDKVETLLRVADSGKGISKEFQKHGLFTAFKQEDPFASGTGLGLNIVKQLTESLNGSLELSSEQGKGTTVEVKLDLTLSNKQVTLPDHEILSLTQKTRGLRLCILEPKIEEQQGKDEEMARMDTCLAETCSVWFGMEVTKSASMDQAKADIFIYTEPPSVEYLLEHHNQDADKVQREQPLIIVCMNAAEAIETSNNHAKQLSQLGRIVEVIPQPCGPRKLAKVFGHCLDQLGKSTGEEMQAERNEEHPVDDPASLGSGEDFMVSAKAGTATRDNEMSGSPSSKEKQELFKAVPKRVPLSTAVDSAFQSSQAASFGTSSASKGSKRPRPSPSDRSGEGTSASSSATATPSLHALVVDDNKINVDLLVRFMKKQKFTYVEAYNGQEALDKFIAAAEQHDDNTVAMPDAHAIDLLDEDAMDTSGGAAAQELQDVLNPETYGDANKQLASDSASPDDANQTDRQPSGEAIVADAIQQQQTSSSSAASSSNPNSKSETTLSVQTNKPFEYILMDISMPIMDGIKATSKIREFEKRHALKPARILALTAFASAETQAEAHNAGVDVFLAKPVKFTELKEVLLR